MNEFILVNVQVFGLQRYLKKTPSQIFLNNLLTF